MAVPATSPAVGGDLDTTFDGDGVVTTGVASGNSSVARAVAIQTDSKIVVVGYSADGTDCDDDTECSIGDECAGGVCTASSSAREGQRPHPLY